MSADACTAPHPAPRAVHTLRNALQLLYAVRDMTQTADHFDAITRVVEILEEAPADVAALYQHGEAQAEELDSLRADLYLESQQKQRDAAYLATVESANSRLAAELVGFRDRIDRLNQHFTDHAGAAAVLAVEARKLKRDADTASPTRPYSITHYDAPLFAARSH